MKKTLSVLILVLLLSFSSNIVQASPKVLLNGKVLTFDVPPKIEQGRTLVPLRAIFEALGAEVRWDQKAQMVTALKGDIEIKLVIGGEASRNSKSVALDVPAKIERGRTLVPLRFVSEALGCNVDWDGQTQTVTVKAIPVIEKDELYKEVGILRGNTPGNSINRGLAVEYDGWIYYRNSSNGNKLYKVKTDGTHITKLNDDQPVQINVFGDWIYYQTTDLYPRTTSNSSYKIKIDGSEKSPALSEVLVNPNFVGNTVFYRNAKGLLKSKFDGTGRIVLLNDSVIGINVVGDWIYYTDGDKDKPKLYKMKVDGSQITELTDDCYHSFIVSGDWIYYTNLSDNRKLYKMRTDGTEKTKLADDPKVSYLNACKDWIYYTSYSGGKGNDLYKIKKDGTDRTSLIIGYDVNYINIVGDWIYTVIYNQIYKLRADGTERQIVQ